MACCLLPHTTGFCLHDVNLVLNDHCVCYLSNNPVTSPCQNWPLKQLILSHLPGFPPRPSGAATIHFPTPCENHSQPFYRMSGTLVSLIHSTALSSLHNIRPQFLHFYLSRGVLEDFSGSPAVMIPDIWWWTTARPPSTHPELRYRPSEVRPSPERLLHIVPATYNFA